MFAFDRLDRYTLRGVLGPLAAVLATLLVAQLLERLLRLLDLVSTAGAPLQSVGAMFASLVPHYLGLTLPMAFTAAIFVATARLSDDCELDVMLSAGRSIGRIAAPCFALAVLLVPFNAWLFGELQPLGRYVYHVAVDRALATGWNAKVEANRFVAAGKGYTFSADAVDPDGLHLHGVFVERRDGGNEEAITALRGRFERGADGKTLLLRLEDGISLRESPGDSVASVSRFAEGRIERDLLPSPRPERERGDAIRERTLGELWRSVGQPEERKAAAEFHARLARVVFLPLLPLWAIPLGMAAKRGRRTPGVVFAGLALLAVNHAMQFGQSLAETGRVAPAVGVWTPVALFAVTGLWIFRGSLQWPGDNAVVRAVRALEGWLDGGLRLLRRAPKAAA